MMMNMHAYLGGKMKTSVIIHGLHNEFSLDQMKACISLAEKYGGSFRHVVTGIQITGIDKDDKEADESTPAFSNFPIKATPSSNESPNALICGAPETTLSIRS